jgi:hypothetical protein
MKGQDLLLLLKLVSLGGRKSLAGTKPRVSLGIPDDWQGWASSSVASDMDPLSEVARPYDYSVRALEQSTGISKTEVSLCLRRCIVLGLARQDRHTGLIGANAKALFEFIVYAIKYVFPATRGPVVRGIATATGAPVLAGRLMAGGDEVVVWEDANGLSKGHRVDPIYKSVPYAVRRDADLYAMLALVDSIRLGRGRETAVASRLLGEYMKVAP